MRATVVITTKDRKEELRSAIRSALAQNPPVEVLVIDDGSSDGTAELVQTEFPGVNLKRYEESRGLIVRRNEAAGIANGEFVISMDDDAEFSSSDIVEITVRDFRNPHVAAIAIPFKDVKRGEEVKQRSPGEGDWITNEFIGTAHAIRRLLFMQLNGYRESLVHQGEEGDLCIRLLDAGYFVQLGRSEPILHHESVTRSSARVNIYGQRNLILFAWYNVPMPYLLVHLPATIWKGLLWGIRSGSFLQRVWGTCRGIQAVFGQLSKRQPVRKETYLKFRRLKKEGPIQVV